MFRLTTSYLTLESLSPFKILVRKTLFLNESQRIEVVKSAVKKWYLKDDRNKETVLSEKSLRITRLAIASVASTTGLRFSHKFRPS